MKRIINTLSQKWPEYLIESFVIVASILGAYALDNWNEVRSIRASEQVILKNLRAEVLTNKKSLQMIQHKHREAYNSEFELLTLFGKDISNLSTKKLDTLLANAESAWTFEPSDGYMKSIIASGKIDYIQNDELKSLITAYDGQVTNAIQEIPQIHKLLHERLWPEIDGKINSSHRILSLGNQNFPKGAYESDYEWFFKSRVIEDIISNIMAWMEEVMGDEQILMNTLDRMMVLIDQEIINQEK